MLDTVSGPASASPNDELMIWAPSVSRMELRASTVVALLDPRTGTPPLCSPVGVPMAPKFMLNRSAVTVTGPAPPTPMGELATICR